MDPHGHSVRELARLAGVTERSVRRWKAAGNVPEPYSTRVALLLETDLGVLSPEWRGWSLRRGELVSPEGLRLLPREIRALPLQVTALAIHRAEAQASRQDRKISRDIRQARDDLEIALAMMDAAVSAIRCALHAALAHTGPPGPDASTAVTHYTPIRVDPHSN